MSFSLARQPLQAAAPRLLQRSAVASSSRVRHFALPSTSPPTSPRPRMSAPNISPPSPLAPAVASAPLELPGAPTPLPSAPAESGYSASALPPTSDPLFSAFVNHLMRDGKKAQARAHVLGMLSHMAQWLHSDPLVALRSAVATAAPLTRMQTSKQAGKSVPVPLALYERQSRRRAIVAIIEASKKRADRFLDARLAREVCAVLEGNSSVLQKKEEAHKVATLNRSNAAVRV